jgi:hypothetical protein
MNIRLHQLLKGFFVTGSELVRPEDVRKTAEFNLQSKNMLEIGQNFDTCESATSVEVCFAAKIKCLLYQNILAIKKGIEVYQETQNLL